MCSGDAQRLYDVCYQYRLNVDADVRSQMSSTETDIKRIYENVKCASLLTKFFSLENIVIFL